VTAHDGLHADQFPVASIARGRSVLPPAAVLASIGTGAAPAIRQS